jgi:hypothetical protein
VTPLTYFASVSALARDATSERRNSTAAHTAMTTYSARRIQRIVLEGDLTLGESDMVMRPETVQNGIYWGVLSEWGCPVVAARPLPSGEDRAG